jgi:hypothetical protein
LQKLQGSPRKRKKITNKPCNYAMKTLHLLENAITSFIFLLQEPDGAPLAVAAPAPGMAPLGPGQKRNAETEHLRQRGADALHPLSPA